MNDHIPKYQMKIEARAEKREPVCSSLQQAKHAIRAGYYGILIDWREQHSLAKPLFSIVNRSRQKSACKAKSKKP